MVSLEMANYLGNGAYSGGRGRPNDAWLECARQEWKTRGTRCVGLRKAKRVVQGLTPAEAMAVARAAKALRPKKPYVPKAARQKSITVRELKHRLKSMGIPVSHKMVVNGMVRYKPLTKQQLINKLSF